MRPGDWPLVQKSSNRPLNVELPQVHRRVAEARRPFFFFPYSYATGALPACPTILDVIGDLLADGRQIEEFLLNEGIFGLFGKLPIHSRLLPKIFIPVHVSSCLARS
jgi:hypothetical protein